MIMNLILIAFSIKRKLLKLSQIFYIGYWISKWKFFMDKIFFFFPFFQLNCLGKSHILFYVSSLCRIYDLCIYEILNNLMYMISAIGSWVNTYHWKIILSKNHVWLIIYIFCRYIGECISFDRRISVLLLDFRL